MFSKKGILALLTAAFSLVWLVGFSQAEAQQMPSPLTAKATASPTATPPPTEDDEVIKVDSEVVNVLFTAQEKSRRLLTTLRQEDIRIIENGQPQEIVAFSRQVDLPLSLAVLIDVSGSQERTLPEEKAAELRAVRVDFD